MKEVYLRLRSVSMTFEGQTGGQEGLMAWLTRRTHKGPLVPQRYRVEALKNINLEVHRGERLGLIGLNGAGKSTLLKVMAGIYPPTAGCVERQGHVCPMFEFATGFEMNQSGWDNIRIRGLLLGMSKAEIEAKLPEIAAFTELGEFLSYPVRTYSTGMFIRLAFAVSTSINPEILLLDEIMGAGDIQFAEKARKRMFEFMEQGKILVFSSHSFDLLRTYCSRTILLEKGVVIADGPTNEVLETYQTRSLAHEQATC
jgi:lipopolysaccharide transport system ATP-binding protein